MPLEDDPSFGDDDLLVSKFADGATWTVPVTAGEWRQQRCAWGSAQLALRGADFVSTVAWASWSEV